VIEIGCEWGLEGIESLRARASAFVIVDVLSFSTAVSVGVERGAQIIPFPLGDAAAAAKAARELGAVAAAPRTAGGKQPSLSPASLRGLAAGTRLLLPSPNGSRLSLATGDTPTFCACLRNFEAVAEAARRAAGSGVVAVIPAGERWPNDTLRPAIEDLIGAGAVIAALRGRESAEAQVARIAFEGVGDIGTMVRQSVSGRALAAIGFAQDVEVALEVGLSGCAPRLEGGAYSNPV
jgi:2-phosphosulfolactate phosphatase